MPTFFCIGFHLFSPHSDMINAVTAFIKDTQPKLPVCCIYSIFEMRKQFL